MQSICILGATGSIGESTLAVIKLHPERYRVVSLTAGKNYQRVLAQALEFSVPDVVLADESLAKEAQAYAVTLGYTGRMHFGQQALQDIAADGASSVVMAAIVGGAGLLPTLAAAQAGKKILLANKEALVMSGELFMHEVNQNGAQVLPIDSEHNAIFQCLPEDFGYGNLAASGISKILLTGSGGPFRTKPLDEFSTISVAQAVAHPNWSMGQKISVDSATMVNKGLEFIEAKYLFGLANDDIQIVLHPQSTIHSMVQYVDGSVLAQMGNPDMRTPIAHALAYPERISSGVQALDFSQLVDFSFAYPEPDRYPNLYLVLQAAAEGQAACTIINAANEISVAAFLNQEIAFTDIAKINEQVLTLTERIDLTSIEAVIAQDELARQMARSYLV